MTIQENAIVVGVGFDLETHNFTFEGMILTTAGFQLAVPPSEGEEPSSIHFEKIEGLDQGWKFDAISFTGTPAVSPTFHNCWRNVCRDETFPVMVIDTGIIKLDVLSISDKIVVSDLNKAEVTHIAFHVKITVKETLTSRRWTSPDPQVINEKMGG